MRITLILFSIFLSFILQGQDMSSDTLMQISAKVFLFTPKNTKSTPRYILAINYGARFNYNELKIKTKKNTNYCYVYYDRYIKQYIMEAYQEKLQQGVPVEKADSLVFYEFLSKAGSIHTEDFFSSWGGYEDVLKFDKLQGKYHYMDFYAAYKKKKPIYRKNDWKTDRRDSAIFYKSSIERYLLVDSVIYVFTTATSKLYRNRKKAFRIMQRDFKQFVRCICIKEEEDLILDE